MTSLPLGSGWARACAVAVDCKGGSLLASLRVALPPLTLHFGSRLRRTPTTFLQPSQAALASSAMQWSQPALERQVWWNRQR
jgi:hypothetical protein